MTHALRHVSRGLLAGGLCLLLLPLLAGCARGRLHDEHRDVMLEYYSSQATLYESLHKAFEVLGREYYLIHQQYEDLGDTQRALDAERRARALHQTHQQFMNRQAEYQRKLNQLRASDSVTAAPRRPAPTRRPPVQSRISPQTLAPRPAPTPRPAAPRNPPPDMQPLVPIPSPNAPAR